jgi:hypothetical protein
MKFHVANQKNGLFSASLAIALIILVISILNFMPQVSGLTLDASTVCSGWTSDKQPIAASSFLSGQTVYLYYSTFDNHGYAATLQFSLTDPNGLVWDTYTSREEYNSHTETYNSASSSQTEQTSFLKVLDVTSDIQTGTWQITGYYSDTQLFRQTFEVVAGQAAPTSTDPIPSQTDTITSTPTSLDTSAPTYLVGLVIFVLLMVLVVAVIVVVFVRMDRKHKQASEAQPPVKS